MKLYKKKEFLDGDIRTNKYYFCGIRYLKKIWSGSFRETYLFKFKISENKAKIAELMNIKVDMDNVLIPSGKTIDIIIPVYNGYDFLTGLFDSIKENTDLPYRLLVVNDASPDDRVLPLLKHYKNIFQQKMELIDNKENLGFVKTVNKALKLSRNHVVLINTDVVLPKNWASRLLFPIFNDDKVASVTPFSNCATIFSLPNIGDNEFNGDLERVNDKLQYIKPDVFSGLKFPTGVGFCMAMSKKAIESVGLLDEIFARGYGEENDWCQRAIQNGFYNTMAPNLFVWHKHGASFGAEKLKLIEENAKIIKERYPNYNLDVQRSINNDEIYRKVRFVSRILFFNAVAPETQVWFDHCWGGGTEKYYYDQCNELRTNCLVIRLQKLQDTNIKLTYCYKNFIDNLIIKEELLDNYLSSIDVHKLVINNLAGWGDTLSVIDYIGRIKSRKKTFVSFRAHDFAPICPLIHMFNNKNKFCNIKNLSECKKCAAFPGNVDEYHNSFEDFFKHTCDELIVFSQSSKNIITELYPCCKNLIKVVPHKTTKYPKVVVKKHNTINIAILGAIGPLKGLDIVKQLDDILPSYNDVCVKIIGYAPYKFVNIKQTGVYDAGLLHNIMEENNIDIVFISSVVPETFSYTTHEAIAMGIPVACFNLGAQAEYVKKYKKGLVINKIDAKSALDNMISFIKNKGGMA